MDLVGMLKGAVTPDLVNAASKAIGASPDQTKGAIESSLPALLGGLASQAGNAGSFGKIFDMMKGGGDLGGFANKIAGGGAGLDGLLGQGGGILKMLFGDKLDLLLKGLGGVSGLASGGLGKLLALLAPLVMGKLGDVVKSQGLTASSLAGLLTSQKGAIQAALPAALKAPGSGLGDMFGGAPKAAASAVAAAAPAEGGSSMLVPGLLLGALILGALWWFTRGAEPVKLAGDKAAGELKAMDAAKKANQAVADGMKKAGDAAGGAMETAKSALGKLSLPGGVSLDLPEGPAGAVGQKLFDMLSAGKAGAPVALSGLKLSADGATVDPSSAGLAGMVKKLFAAFPALKLKLTGYMAGDKAPAMVKAAAKALGLSDAIVTEAMPPAEGKAEGSFEISVDK